PFPKVNPTEVRDGRRAASDIPACLGATSDLSIDGANGLALFQGQRLRLTPTEFKLLSYMVGRAGALLRPEAIVPDVRGPEHGSDTRLVRTYVKQLRDKLGDDATTPRFIRTEPGLGYRYIHGVEESVS